MIYFSKNKTLLLSDIEDNDIANITDDFFANKNESSLEPQEAGTMINIVIDMDKFDPEVQYYFRLQVLDQQGQTSLSNIARIFLTHVQVKLSWSGYHITPHSASWSNK